jgi:hypothetical protein
MSSGPELTRRCDRTFVLERAEELDGIGVSVRARFAGSDSEFSGGAAGVFEIVVSLRGSEAVVTLAQDCGSTGDIELVRDAKARRLEGELSELRAGYRAKQERAGPVEVDLNELACRLGRAPGSSVRPSGDVGGIQGG